MDRRKFIAGSAFAAAATAVPVHASKKAARGPALLTVTGAISRSNRGPLDPALDQMMAKQKIKFDKAYAFDFAVLSALPSVTIRPTLEYDAKAHALSGPLLADVLAAAGARLADSSRLLLRAVDGYAVYLSIADMRKYGFIVATHLDGQPMPLGGLGPLWALYDADRFAELAAMPLNQRFGQCPWALYHIEVQAA
ncbi:hypothetical protein EDC30_105290 [Paucimonas lemoignei]|uniref:Molybdopterin-dependent oxidoreductase n=1 Tax=Paucimonas lemoignei TaxID=29443 RepID=A0A4R3HV07_PAULE|nr:molybdopterin-dependent oxidoreductase [Paucimonas lemoignei]TCS37067.1 hypothetical protein EDC30_105290 [Paucimonas lemoignei]